MIDLGMLYRHATDALPFLTSLIAGGTLISLLGLALHRAAARTSAAQRHLILAASMLGLLLLPIVQTIGPELRLEILPPMASATVPDAPVMERSRTSSRSATPAVSNPTIPHAAAEEPSTTAGLSTASSIRLLYLAGIIVVIVPLVAGSLRMRWLVRRARPMPEEHELLGAVSAGHAEGTIRILTSESIRVPLAWGWRRSILLLPEEAFDWPREMRRDAIIHELAHLERHDLFFQTIGRIAVALHWFNPLAWIVLRRLLLEAEQACDDRVIEAGTGTADYAERLLKIAAGANHPALRRLSAVAMARSSQLATRIEALFETTRARSGRMGRIRALSTFVAILGPALLIGAVQIDTRSATSEPAPIPRNSFASEPEGSLWARINGDEIRLEKGTTVRVSGSGSVLFREGRKTIAPEEGGRIYTGGNLLSKTAVATGQRVEIVGPESDDRWLIEAVPNTGLDGPGTRISDSDPNATARIDTERMMSFYLSVDDAGHVELYQPVDSSVERRQSPANVEVEWGDDGAADEWDGDADESPLYAAITRGNRPMVEHLLDDGADPNARWDGDGNPLMIAVRHGRHDIVELLLARGARPDEGVEGDGNALIVAAALGDLRSLERFIATGADINRGVLGDGNPLIAAAGEGRIEAIKLLIRHGADLEVVVPGDENALITAAQEGQLEAVRYLVSAGADVNSKVPVRSWRSGETEIRTPLSMARRQGHDEIVRYLRSAGARE